MTYTRENSILSSLPAKGQRLGLGFLLSLILWLPMQSLGQYNWDKFTLKFGFTSFNHFDYGAWRTRHPIAYSQGYGLSPSLGLEYQINDRYLLTGNFEYSWLTSWESQQDQEEWLANTTSSIILGVYRQMHDLRFGLLLSGIRNSRTRGSIYTLDNLPFDRFGPGLSLGYNFEGTAIYLNKDIVVDFGSLLLASPTDFLSLRILRNIKRPKAGPEEDPRDPAFYRRPKLELGVGTELWIDQHSTTKIMSPAVFGQITVQMHRMALFFKRALMLTLEGGFSETSGYTISDNLGLSYALFPETSLGLSLLRDNDGLQRRANDLENRPAILERFFIRGISLHFRQDLSPMLQLTAQYDYIYAGLRYTEYTLSPLQLRGGLMVKM